MDQNENLFGDGRLGTFGSGVLGYDVGATPLSFSLGVGPFGFLYQARISGVDGAVSSRAQITFAFIQTRFTFDPNGTSIWDNFDFDLGAGLNLGATFKDQGLSVIGFVGSRISDVGLGLVGSVAGQLSLLFNPNDPSAAGKNDLLTGGYFSISFLKPWDDLDISDLGNLTSSFGGPGLFSNPNDPLFGGLSPFSPTELPSRNIYDYDAFAQGGGDPFFDSLQNNSSGFGTPNWTYSPDDINVFGDPVIDDFGQIVDPGIPGLSFDYSSPFSGEDLAIDHGVPGVSLDYSSPFAGPGISDDFWGDMEAFGFLPSDVVDVGDGSLDSFTSWDQFVNGGVSDSVFDFDYGGQNYFDSLYEDNFGPGLVADYSGNFNDAFSTIGPYAPVNEYFAPPQVITTTTTQLVPVTTETPTPQGAADFYFNNVVSDAALDPNLTFDYANAEVNDGGIVTTSVTYRTVTTTETRVVPGSNQDYYSDYDFDGDFFGDGFGSDPVDEFGYDFTQGDIFDESFGFEDGDQFYSDFGFDDYGFNDFGFDDGFDFGDGSFDDFGYGFDDYGYNDYDFYDDYGYDAGGYYDDFGYDDYSYGDFGYDDFGSGDYGFSDFGYSDFGFSDFGGGFDFGDGGFGGGFDFGFPIVLDLDGDGVEIAFGPQSQTHFDFDDDGFLEQTSWVSPDDALLIIDLAEDGSAGADGSVTQAREVAFGEWSEDAETDLAALKAVFDTNDDDIFDENDDRWSEFRVWQDLDSDAVVDEGELKTLSEAGVTSFDLISDEELQLRNDGSVIFGELTYTKADATTGIAADAAFSYGVSGYRAVETADGYTIELEAGADVHYYTYDGTDDVSVDLAVDNYAGAYGGDGNDQLDASARTRDSILSGGIGNDILLGGLADDILFGGDGVDTLKGNGGRDTLIADSGDTFTIAYIDGGDGYDQLHVTSDTTLNLVVDDLNVESVRAGDNSDTLSGTNDEISYAFHGGGGDDALTTVGGDDTLTGGEGNDTLIAGAGHDTLIGDGGADTLIAGDGNDAIYVESGDVLTSDHIDGGAGHDQLFANDDVLFDLNVDDLNVEAAYAGGADDNIRGSRDDVFYIFSGGDGNDTLTSAGGNDTLSGGAGDDILNAGAGDDLLIGGDGVDQFDGGAGSDTVDFTISEDGVSVDLQAGTATWDNGDVETLSNIENVVGSRGDDTLIGDANDNTFVGSAGDDTIRGGDGDDDLYGGEGDDIIEGGAGINIISGGLGFDKISYEGSSAAVNLDMNKLGNATDTIESIEGIIGSSHNDELIGDDFANTLEGGAGNDTLIGGGGNDVIEGGAGADTIDGGEGNDSISFENATSGITLNLSNTSGAEDTISNIEGIIGSAHADTLTGDAESNSLLGGDGDDTLDGGLGDDILFGDAGSDALRGGAGDDMLVIDADDVLTAANIDGGDGYDQLVVGGETDFALNLNVDDLNIESVIAWDFDDTLQGNRNDVDYVFDGRGGDDTLSGAGGDDVLVGGAGDDSLSGGAGDDTLSGGSGLDSFDGGSGVDTVDFSTSFENVDISLEADTATFGDGDVETVTNIENVIGSAGDNVIRGDAGDNRLYGGLGDDILEGGSGTDVLDGGLGYDRISFEHSTSGVTYDLGAAGGLVATGNEIQVNTTTSGDQSRSTITALFDGGFVVAWVSDGQDGSGTGLYGQRYNAAGRAVGDEFQINTHTADDQIDPQITGLSDGGFVVTWESELQDGSGTGIFGQRYDILGEAVGDEFQINTQTSGDQINSAVTGVFGGGFVVTWESQGEIFGQRYDPNGSAVDGEFQVNTHTSDSQSNPHVTGLLDGSFVVTWESDLQDSDGRGIFAQRYDGTGSAVGSEFLVNTQTSGNQTAPRVAPLSNGGFIIIWVALALDSSGLGIFGQRYDEDGERDGAEFQINTTTAGDQSDPSITTLADGGFVVTWTSVGQDGSGAGIYSQRFDAEGVAIGDEVQINIQTAGNQIDADITALADGRLFVSWTSEGQDGSGTSVHGRFVEHAVSDIEGLIGSAHDDHLMGDDNDNTLDGGEGNDTLIGGGGDDTLISSAGIDSFDGGEGIDTIDFSDETADVDVNLTTGAATWSNGDVETLASIENVIGSQGANIITGNSDSNSLLGGDGDDTLDGGSGDDILFGEAGSDVLRGGAGDDILVIDVDDVLTGANIDGGDGYDQLVVGGETDFALNLNVDDLNIESVIAWDFDDTLQGNRNDVDYVFDGRGGDDTLSGAGGDDVLIGGAGDDSLSGGAGDDTLSGGSGLDSFDGGSGVDTVDFSTSFENVDVSLEADTATFGDGDVETVTNIENVIGSAGDNVIRGDAGDNRLYGGAGDDILEGGSGTDVLDGGLGYDRISFEHSTSGVTYDLAAAGGLVATGNEIQVNTTTSGDQSNTAITALFDGGFVVAWVSDGQDGSGTGLFGQRYNAAGRAVGDEFQINTHTADDQIDPQITSLSDGGFVVTWESELQDGSGTGIFGQRYDILGEAVGDEFQINTQTSGDQVNSSVTGLFGGGFIVTWESQGEIFGQRYDPNGSAVDGEFQINTHTSDSQSNPHVTGLLDSGFVVTWESDLQDGDGRGIFAQRYDATGSAVGSEFLVNTQTSGNQTAPRVAPLSNGGFIIIWVAVALDGSGLGIFGQRYDENGAQDGTEFQINTTTAGDQSDPSITTLADGGFVVTWTSQGQDGSGAGIYIQRFNAEGVAIGDEVQINVQTAGNQIDADITALADGRLFVSWTSEGQDGSGTSVHGRFVEHAVSNIEGLIGSDHDDHLIGDDNANTIDGGEGNDTLIGGAGDDTLVSSAGIDSFDGGEGVDTLDFGDETADVDVNLATGAAAWSNGDVETLTNIENVIGSQGANVITGNAESNSFLGGDGDDTLDGGLGDDILFGDAGSDALRGGHGNDVLTGGDGIDSYDGGEGVDTIDLTNTVDDIHVNLNAGTVTWNSSDIETVSNVENVIGNSNANTIVGDGSDNRLVGLDGDDTISGGAGDDFISGGFGNDTLDGGAGIDLVTYEYTSGNFDIDLAGGIAAGETVTNFENVIASQGDNVITGTQDGNVIDGQDGDDTVYGDSGDDRISGGLGDDILYGDAGYDDLFGHAGDDELYGGNGDDLISGGSGDDTIDTGVGIDKILFSRGYGNDTIFADAVDDFNYDILSFGPDISMSDLFFLTPNGSVTGDLVIYIQDQSKIGNGGLYTPEDTITIKGWNTYENRVADIEFSNGNLIWVAESDYVHSGTEGEDNIVINNAGLGAWVIGGDGNDHIEITTSDAWDTIVGGRGDDVLIGGTGDDAYHFETGDGRDTITDSSGQEDELFFGSGILLDDLRLEMNGSDLVIALRDEDNPEATVDQLSDSVTITNWSSSDYRINWAYFDDGREFQLSSIDNVVNQTAGGSGALTGTNNADWIDGGINSDTLHGLDGFDTMFGRQGDDDIEGGGGNDTIFGGAGNDIVKGDAGSDMLIGGLGDDNIQGGSDNDILLGEAGDDIIDGGAGDDFIDGGEGEDTLQLAGTRANYDITDKGDGSFEIVDNRSGSPDGTDTVLNVESFQFSDTTLTESTLAPVAPTDITLTGGSVYENAAAGVVVAVLSAVDTNANETFSYTLTNDPSGFFEIVGDELRVAPGATLNYETTTSYDVTIEATDGTGNTYSKVITLSVTNENEAPTGVTYTGGSVAENAVPGTVVATLSAADVDVGDTFSYTLTDDPSGFFVIVGNEIRVASGASLDYETTSSHDVTVEVRDSGGRTYSEVISLTVADEDETPTDITYTGGSVTENAASGTVAATLAAVDPDTGETFSYTLANDPSGFFEVVGNELRVAAGAALNYEAAISHDITVEVTDGAGNTLSEVITIAVTDINEAPTDIVVSGGAIAENSAGGEVVATLATTDEDAGETFVYTLTSDPSGYFDVVQNEIHVAPGATLDYETATSHDVTIQVTDNVGNTYSELVTLTVTDVDETPPLNVITGTSNYDELIGTSGNDQIEGLGAGDDLYGEGGEDILFGGDGRDLIFGGSGNDEIYGEAGHDDIAGDAGDDVISGGGGHDYIYGDEGNDIITGGSGDDAFAFLPDFGQDVITDFTPGAGSDDYIVLDGLGYGSFSSVITDAYQSGSDTIIDTGDGNTITLTDVNVSSLHSYDFEFY